MTRREPQTPEEWRSRAAWARRKAETARTLYDKRKFLAIAEMDEAVADALERAQA